MFCRVKDWALFCLRITLFTLLTVALLKVKVPVAPAVEVLLPTKKPATRAFVISIAPTVFVAEVLQLIPTPVAAVGFAPNCATWVDVGTAPPVQLPPVNHPDPPDELHKI